MNRYAELLDAAWADHLAPRREDAPTVISTFAGCGGSSLGYSMAGCRTLLAVEWDRNAVDTYRRNFRHTLVHHGDIAALGVTDVLARTGLRSGELDVLDGSPTCQGFSTAGKRAIDDPRNQLFREYARLLRGLEPRVFVMENVSGLVKGKMKLLFAEILRELMACGYRVSARLLNAMYFNVPQSRERMIFIGVQEDLGIEPSHPKAQSRPLTLRDALVPPPDPGSHGGNVSELRARRWAETRRGSKHHERFSLNRLSWSKPAPTILRVSDSGGHMHPDTPRLLSTGELQRCASFPDGFEFIGGWSDSVERIGNSVPPLFMRAIARHVDSVILAKAASHLSGET